MGSDRAISSVLALPQFRLRVTLMEKLPILSARREESKRDVKTIYAETTLRLFRPVPTVEAMLV
jgi:hypothetical protein